MAFCPGCSLDSFSVEKLKLHLKLNHPNDVILKCRQPSCCRTFSNWADFRRHLSSFHKIPKDGPTTSGELPVPTAINKNSDMFPDLGADAMPVNEESQRSKTSHTETAKTYIFKSFLSLIGKLYAAPNLPRNFVQTMVSEITFLFSEICSQASEIFDDNTCSENDSVIGFFKEVLISFEQCKTEWSRMKLLSESGALIKPEPYVVGSETKDVRVEGRIVRRIVPLTGQYVPLNKVLHSFFSLPGVLKETLDYVNFLERDEGVLSNFVQGSLWRAKKELYFKNQIVLPLFIFYDDFEINNPLGSHAGSQKLGGTYFTIGCLPPEHRSELQNIFLAMLTYAADRKSPFSTNLRNASVFRVLVDQINSLQQEGICFRNDKGENFTIFFAFGLLLGDNEGLNSTQDFLASSHYCRFCKATSDNIKKDVYENQSLLRRVNEYDDDVHEKNGLKCCSVWNDIQGHHVYRNYSVDLLHDMQEGGLKYGMYHVVFHYLNITKNFSLETLNRRMRTFDYYGNGLTNRPPLISERDINEKKLRMSGSEMFNFTITFAMLVGDLIKSDRVWEYYLCLRKIMSFVGAPAIQTEYVDSFNDLVAHHHDLYKKLFKDDLKPKHHNWVHYGRIMKEVGPLCFLSTSRYESKHRPNKIRATSTYSRRDPPYTLALKEQMQLCHRLLSREGFTSRLEIGATSILSDSEKHLFNLPPSFNNCLEVSSIELKGTSYRPGMFINHEVEEVHGLPNFGKIVNILINEDSEVSFYCRRFFTVGLQEHLMAYEISELDSYFCVMVEDLVTFHPLIFHHMSSGEIFITFKHVI